MRKHGLDVELADPMPPHIGRAELSEAIAGVSRDLGSLCDALEGHPERLEGLVVPFQDPANRPVRLQKGKRGGAQGGYGPALELVALADLSGPRDSIVDDSVVPVHTLPGGLQDVLRARRGGRLQDQIQLLVRMDRMREEFLGYLDRHDARPGSVFDFHVEHLWDRRDLPVFLQKLGRRLQDPEVSPLGAGRERLTVFIGEFGDEPRLFSLRPVEQHPIGLMRDHEAHDRLDRISGSQELPLERPVARD
ncbi:MAG TPA: hypothetical protein VGE08_20375 [Steroidobacter sp.]|uniref:hypothetical protein n=1 Tax=Steroidobacter sp. TaxID=1978227 RepID=UPI002EDBAD72